MSRNCNNLCLSPPPCCLPACSIPCSVICCTPPVSYPCMPHVPRVQCRIACRPQSVPKPTKAVVYLPPCPTCPMSYPPKMEVTYLPPSPPSSPACFYVCKTKCVPCMPLCSKQTVMRPSSGKILCPPCPPVRKCSNWRVADNYVTACSEVAS